MNEQNKTDKMKEMMKKSRKANTTEGICERFYKDVTTYLTSKLPDVPEHVIIDIAAFCGNRMMVTANDLLFERDREWRTAMRDNLKRRRRDVIDGTPTDGSFAINVMKGD